MNDPIADLDQRARELLDAGRLDVLKPRLHEYLEYDVSDAPWAALALAVAVNAENLHDPRAETLLNTAQHTFQMRSDSVGLGYVGHLSGLQALAQGRYQDAVSMWSSARHFLGNDLPIAPQVIARLSLSAYHEGDLTTALAAADEAVALARSRVDRGSEGMALVCRGLIAVSLGDFPAATVALESAGQVYREIPDPLDRSDEPLVWVIWTVVHGWQGERAATEAAAQQAVELSRQGENPWFKAMALAVRADYCGRWDPVGCVADGRRAVELCQFVGDPWFETWGLRALGAASAYEGHLSVGRQVLEQALEKNPSAFEQARTKLAYGEVLLAMGESRLARVTLVDAADVFANAKARYLHARACVALGLADPDHHRRWTARFLAARLPGPAYDTLDDPATVLIAAPAGHQEFRVSVLGDTHVALGGVEVTFGNSANAVRVFLALALAGSTGLHDEEIVAMCWPDRTVADCNQNLRTLRRQIRAGLGSESWRLSRVQGTTRIERQGMAIDLVDLQAEAARVLGAPRDDPGRREAARLADALSRQLLSAYRYEPWVEEHGYDNSALITRLRRFADGS